MKVIPGLSLVDHIPPLSLESDYIFPNLFHPSLGTVHINDNNPVLLSFPALAQEVMPGWKISKLI